MESYSEQKNNFLNTHNTDQAKNTFHLLKMFQII